MLLKLDLQEQTARRKLESVQMRVGRSLLGASNTVAGVIVLRDLGWRKLGERKEEKILNGRLSKALRQTSDGSGRQIKNG